MLCPSEKTLYGIFFCLAVLASSSKFHSYLCKKKTRKTNKKFQKIFFKNFLTFFNKTTKKIKSTKAGSIFDVA